ncbi:MAG: hypothetical protein JXB15_00700 [Anaerolineales bacterium]|nr:hypothetical protein [Anaerolineales bacterium]
MESESTQLIQVNGWTIRQRLPTASTMQPVFLLLHGWTGDENAMWIFARRLPEKALLLAPRAPHPAPQGGYSWRPNTVKGWPWMDDFEPSVQALVDLLRPDLFPQADFSNLRLVGYSQGAALAFAFSLLHPEGVLSIAALSGFVPDGAQVIAATRPLAEKPIFMAHGVYDRLVPVERARAGVKILEQAGAQVHYCEDEVGHKLSADCFRAMQAFFERN